MNDFSGLEAELKKLRPRSASPELAARIEQALAEEPARLGEASGRTATAGVLPKRRSFRVNWLGLGLGLAAAAAFLVLARVNVEQPGKRQSVVAMTPAPFAPPIQVSDTFVPAGLTQVVYNTRDEGLHFPEGADQPVRRVRTRKRETLQWRNPGTGTSLRVSYPSEEVTLIPVSGQ
jgi:negative regulator of sigma E activity